MSDLVILEGDQLRKLARIIRNQEANAIKNIKFQYEHELAQYLRASAGNHRAKDGDNYESVIRLLDDNDVMKHTFKDDKTRSLIANDIFSYIVSSVNLGLQEVKNYALRVNYLRKISQHRNEIVQYRNYMLEYTRNRQSVAARSFSRYLKNSGIKFNDLLKRMPEVTEDRFMEGAAAAIEIGLEVAAATVEVGLEVATTNVEVEEKKNVGR
ncbi:uncharacterized protein LOC111025189 isoform X1 [Momordica charantia]|uniref:Uncharacterized protein LOC111025189 isoform X1 n=1 Tax=Momordica charantia TaxID=3673 RepID=A0A6J1DWX6_MOMCH|nr:uncharacterized protein LOC111025189 isoform X1 [Momordica charantia]